MRSGAAGLPPVNTSRIAMKPIRLFELSGKQPYIRQREMRTNTDDGFETQGSRR
jgi:hypothetical protein